ncbi:hypothetical protein [Streptomyces acidicola]|nr:hypothetical protein [Streptomyces acidicola]
MPTSLSERHHAQDATMDVMDMRDMCDQPTLDLRHKRLERVPD